MGDADPVSQHLVLVSVKDIVEVIPKFISESELESTSSSDAAIVTELVNVTKCTTVVNQKHYTNNR